MLIICTLVCAVIVNGHAQGKDSKTGGGGKSAAPDGQAVALAFTKQVIVPVSMDVARKGVDLANVTAKLAFQMEKRFPARQAPDLALVRLYLKELLLSNNTLLATPGATREYPAEADFDRFAAGGRAELKKYAGRLDKEHRWGPTDNAAVQNILRAELKKGLRTLPAYRGKGLPAAAPLTREDEALLKGKAGI